MATARRYGVVIAHESHNHPSQVVPFEGAATGIGGIVRDVLCMGAEVIAHRRSAALRTRRGSAVASALRRAGRCRRHRRVRQRDRRSEYRRRRVFRRAASTTIAWSTSWRSGSSKKSEIVHSAAPPGLGRLGYRARRQSDRRQRVRRRRVLVASRSTKRTPMRTRARFKFPIRFSKTSHARDVSRVRISARKRA